MSDRLSALDASRLAGDRPGPPAMSGRLAIFSPSRNGLDYDALVQLIEQRIALVPRYRQKVKTVPGGLARPVWVDDNDFDINFHVRRCALAAPGGQQQLDELVARLLARRLDRTRPLWETYLVEGLVGGGVAVISNTHAALIAGAAPGLDDVILDESPHSRTDRGRLWMPVAEPGRLGLLAEAAEEVIHRPSELVGALRWVTRDRTGVRSYASAVACRAATGLRHLGRTHHPGPLSATHPGERGFATAHTRLADYRQVRECHGGTAADVVLAVLSGALRHWMQDRADAVTPTSTVRVLAPHRGPGALVDLPVGQADALARLTAVTSGGAAPGRIAGRFGRAAVTVLIGNLSGPQRPCYAAGARMTALVPAVRPGSGQALTVGVAAYDGQVSYGLTAHGAAAADVGDLAGRIEQSLRELVQASARAGVGMTIGAR